MLFVSFGVMGSVVGIVLNVLDYQSGSILNRSQSKQVGIDGIDKEALLGTEC